MIEKVEDITIKDYQSILAVLNSDKEGYVKEIDLLSIIHGIDCWDLTIDEVSSLKHSLNVINSIQDASKSKDFQLPKVIEIGGEKCTIMQNANTMSVNQYYSFSEYNKHNDNNDSNLQNLMACIIIPEGKTYNKGYDIEAFAESIRNEMSFIQARNVLANFLIASEHSLNNSLVALRLYLKMKSKMSLRKKERQMYKMMLKMMEINEKLESLNS